MENLSCDHLSAPPLFCPSNTTLEKVRTSVVPLLANAKEINREKTNTRSKHSAPDWEMQFSLN